MHENVPNLDIILGQCIASMTVNNQLFVSMTREMCTECEQLAVSQVTWLGQPYPKHHQELDWKQENSKQMLAVDMIHATNDYIICLDMWHDHPGKFVLTLLNVLTLCCRNCLLWPVIQDNIQCTFPLCQWSKQLVINCHWSSTLD